MSKDVKPAGGTVGVNPDTVAAVLAVLTADAGRRGGRSHLSSRAIAERVGVSDRTVRGALNGLEAGGSL